MTYKCVEEKYEIPVIESSSGNAARGSSVTSFIEILEINHLASSEMPDGTYGKLDEMKD